MLSNNFKKILESDVEEKSKKIEAFKIQKELLKEFSGRPTLATILQLMQITIVISLNLIINFLGK